MSKNLHASGSTECPAYLELLRLGYTVTCDRDWPGGPMCFAEDERWNLSADSLVTILGLHFLLESRGESWHATDEEISEFIEKFQS